MNNQSEQLPNYENDEITLKELILKIKEFSKEIVRNWMLVLVFILPFLAYFLYQAFTTPKYYKADLTFMLNEESGGGIGGFGGILGSLGIGGGGGGGSYSLDKILELSRTRQIIEKALFTKIKINEQDDYFANHLIREYNLQGKSWKNDPTLNNFLFTNTKTAQFSKVENKALMGIFSLTTANGLFSSSFSKNSGILTFSVNSTSEDLSIELVKSIFDQLSKFYINKSVQKEQETYDLLKHKVDSLKYLLYGKEAGLAKFEDSNLFLQEQTVQLPKKRLNRDVQMLTIMYGEAIKNLELAEFSLSNKKPFLQAIDMPIAPLKPVVVSKVKNGLIGFMLGIVLASIFIVIRKIVREAMV